MGRKVRAAIVAAALAVGGLLAGALSAQALGEVGVPGVTVTVPTVSLPIPTPPAPAPVPAVPPPPPTPAVTLATPPAPVPGPDSPSPPPPSRPSSAPPSPASAPSPPPGRSGSAEASSGSYFPASAELRRRPAAPGSRRARVSGMRARPGRVARRGGRRTAVRISFTLTDPIRVVFVVRGPAPSCGVAGRFTVRGHRGVNHVRFTGRVGRRELPSGTYRISAITSGRPANRSVVVVLGDRAPPTRFQCPSPSPQASPFVSMLATFTPRTGPARTAPTPQPVMKKPAAAGDEPDSGVLPAVTDRLRNLPESVPKPHLPNASASPPWILGAAALLLLVISSLALLVYLVRFLRGSHAT